VDGNGLVSGDLFSLPAMNGALATIIEKGAK
jgi:hypothetical protein